MVHKTFINLHLSPSFGRHFSQKNGSDQTEQVQQFSSSKNSLSSHESDCLDNPESESTWQKEAPERLVLDSDVKLKKMTGQNDDLDNRVDMSKPSKGCSEDFKSFDSVSLLQEVQENLYYSQEKINQNEIGVDASDGNPSSLVELVNVIDSIFSSVKRTSITKEELLQKIMMNCLDFVEISEAEEQIEILEKIVPDWICKKLVSSGDTMYCVKNAVDLESIRSRLLSNVTKGDE
ncbi:CDT1 protein a, chloroplastic [Trifolium repens]|nr:CDT1 protein a, chloroplastic [Trifolium repens]